MLSRSRPWLLLLGLVIALGVGAEAFADAETSDDGGASIVNRVLGGLVSIVAQVFFFDLSFGIFGERALPDGGTAPIQVPLLIAWLGGGAIFLTVYHGFINVRAFGHAWAVVRGKWSGGADGGDIAPFQAFTSALSATVGLGNIASVASAMVIGGPGALFWMVVLGFCGMTAKFHETTLAQLYRVENPDGSVSGGPMYFISRGFRDLNPKLGGLGAGIAAVFAVLLMMASLGGGNLYQVNQAYEGFFDQFVAPGLADAVGTPGYESTRGTVAIGFGLLMAVLVGAIVLGGITRIGRVTSVIVPFMAVLYVSACWVIIGSNLDRLPSLIGSVFAEAFTPEAGLGGVIGVLMVGFQRAAFSSESGLGSSAVAHAAAKTAEPVREGFVASLEPFVDTIVICTTTGLTVLVTGAYVAEGLGGDGAAVTLYAFEQKPILNTLRFPEILAVSIVLFALSTMISWCYYGERAWGYLFGVRSVVVFRLVFVAVVFLGALTSGGVAIDLADLSLLACAFPNLLGGFILAPLVKRRLRSYWAAYREGRLVPGVPVAHAEAAADR